MIGEIQELSFENSIKVGDLTFFYYEVYEKEFDEELRQWPIFGPESFFTNVISHFRSLHD